MDQISFPIFVIEGQKMSRINVLICTYGDADTRRTGLSRLRLLGKSIQ